MNGASDDAFENIALRAADRLATATVRPAHARALTAGHFPDDPLLPGAYLAGLMADLAERLLATVGARVHLAEVVRCTFSAPVRPDAEVVITVGAVAGIAGGWVVDAEVRAGGRRAARATLRFENEV